jgi:hypothetical protein
VLNATQDILATTPDLTAHDFCFYITLVNLVPVFVLALLAVTFAAALLYAPCVIVPKIVALLVSSVLNLHHEDI